MSKSEILPFVVCTLPCREAFRRCFICGCWFSGCENVATGCLGGPQGRKKLSDRTASRKGSCTAELHGNAADVSHPSSKQLAQPALCSSSRFVVFCSLTTAAASNCHPSIRVLFLFHRCLLPLDGYKPQIHFYMTPSFMRWPLEAVCSIALRPSIIICSCPPLIPFQALIMIWQH